MYSYYVFILLFCHKANNSRLKLGPGNPVCLSRLQSSFDVLSIKPRLRRLRLQARTTAVRRVLHKEWPPRHEGDKDKRD